MGLLGSKPEAPEADMLPQFREAGYAAGGLVNWALRNRQKLTPYEGDWVADMNKGQLSAIDRIFERGMAGSPLIEGAQGYGQDVLSGKYLSEGNPYLQQAMDAARDDIGRQVGGAFSTGGMAGSPMHQQYLTEAWSDATAPLLFQNYQNERNAQQQMAGLATELGNADFSGLQQALGAKGLLQQQQQSEIDATREKHDLTMSEPYRRASAAMAAMGGGATQAQMYGGSGGEMGTIPGILQGGMGGALMGGVAGGAPGAVIGGIAGGAGGGAANK